MPDPIYPKGEWTYLEAFEVARYYPQDRIERLEEWHRAMVAEGMTLAGQACAHCGKRVRDPRHWLGDHPLHVECIAAA